MAETAKSSRTYLAVVRMWIMGVGEKAGERASVGGEKDHRLIPNPAWIARSALVNNLITLAGREGVIFS